MINGYDYYRKLITSEYRYSPRFNEMTKKLVGFGLDVDMAVDKILSAFDIDNASTDQLDILGQIVGVTRDLSFTPSVDVTVLDIVSPIPAAMASATNVINTPAPSFFDSADVYSGSSARDLSHGNVLSEDIFRMMIKARIIQNVWKGTITELYDLWKSLFGNERTLAIQDLQDMSFNIILRGDYTQLERELIANAYIIPKPEGVRINIITFISSDGLPIMSYHYDNATYSGYKSHWVESEEING